MNDEERYWSLQRIKNSMENGDDKKMNNLKLIKTETPLAEFDSDNYIIKIK